MEYPTITLLNSRGSQNALNDVIFHEVGHNWFYGILGTNGLNASKLGYTPIVWGIGTDHRMLWVGIQLNELLDCQEINMEAICKKVKIRRPTYRIKI